MPINRRRKVRKPGALQACIFGLDGAKLVACQTVNFSDGGAKIVVSSGAEIPREFLLIFSTDGKVRRRCQMMWRNGGDIGVRFVP